MARVVRKVSNKNLANANKNKKVNKWLIGGISAGVVVAIAVAIILWVVLGGNDESEKVDYFNTYTYVEEGNSYDLTFTKANYNGLLNVLDENYPSYVDEGITIVFAYNSNNFDPENEDDTQTAKAQKELLNRIAHIQLTVDQAKELGIKVELYIVDISISDSDWAIMNDPTFGGNTSVTGDNVNYVEPLLAYIDNGSKDKLVKDFSNYNTSTITYTSVPRIIEELETKIAAAK